MESRSRSRPTRYSWCVRRGIGRLSTASTGRSGRANRSQFDEAALSAPILAAASCPGPTTRPPTWPHPPRWQCQPGNGDDAALARAIERVDPSVPIGGIMELEPVAAPRIDIAKLPYFNGFPYLATRLASAVYHIRLLPALSAVLHWPNAARTCSRVFSASYSWLMGLPSRSSGVWDPAGRCRSHASAQGQQARRGVCVWRAA